MGLTRGGRERLGYRPALDGVRALAIAIVVSFHAFGWPGEGTLGVDLFFVLSGFLITTLLLEEHETMGTISIRRFYGRRARRLLPALSFLMAPFLLLAAVSAATTGSLRSPLFVGLASALTYTSNIVVAADPSAIPAGMIHLWSLAAEEQFYIVWPLLLLALIQAGGARLVARALVVLLMVAVVYRLQLLMRGASIERLYYGPDTHADSLLIGCAFGCYLARRGLPAWIRTSARARELASVVALALVIAAVVLIERIPQRLAYETQLLPTAFALVAGVFVVCAVAGETVVARGLSLRPVVSLGRISYSLYLWHLPLLVAFAGVHRELGWRTIAAVAAAVALASCSRKFIEIPFLLRRTGAETGRLDGTPAPAPA
jgi:peptidoglycan/LPS O-acetylase OafA/YrhL